jgi:cytochrome c-type biogenesis protein CcmE
MTAFRSGRSWRARLAIAGVLTLLGGLVLAAAMQGTLTYARSPADLVDHPGEHARVEGTVVRGTLHQHAGAADFELSGGGTDLHVHADTAPSGIFRDGQGAVVEGTMGTDGVFHADRVIAQHGNRYRGADTVRSGGAGR